VFLYCCLINLVLITFGGCLAIDLSAPTPGKLKFWQIWQWVFAFPFMVADYVGMPMIPWWPAYVVLNVCCYGGIWWFAWRMWKLFRRKSPE